ncbi:HAD-IA family hydrolase [Lentzea tibetensis]|uniref:HAD-IA family hydrolase n=1 Tax=Lentzea tibetensis TaxID=2591470 RepID=A0A563EUD9_9PSEU|nr:HAD-IA family hydrolase [Lentzea tibetensis]TWP51148.1 HAD-IA family hydrolase [Lentzea tibetensis]
MTIRAALFDFSGTLFRMEHPEITELGDVLRAATAPSDPALAEAWERRDLDADQHRYVFLTLLRQAGLPDPDGFYERMCGTEFWVPYPDTAAALELLADVPVAVVSNMGFDIRPALDAHGLSQYVDEVVLSFEEGVIKPDPKIFKIACERLGVDPAETVMVGDSEEADGGARAIGCQFALVEPLPTGDRAESLLAVARTISV